MLFLSLIMWTKSISKQSWLILGIVIAIMIGSTALFLSSMIGTTTQQSNIKSQSITTIASSSDSNQIELDGQQTGFGHTLSNQSCSMSIDVQNATWNKYLGYIPSDYCIAARGPNSPIFPCPTGMSTTQCQVFQQTCGDGVCNPNETCSTCPVDCGVTGGMVCDPYTGRAGAPASVCQVQAANPLAP
jgi:hypothetical protein